MNQRSKVCNVIKFLLIILLFFLTSVYFLLTMLLSSDITICLVNAVISKTHVNMSIEPSKTLLTDPLLYMAHTII